MKVFNKNPFARIHKKRTLKKVLFYKTKLFQFNWLIQNKDQQLSQMPAQDSLLPSLNTQAKAPEWSQLAIH